MTPTNQMGPSFVIGSMMLWGLGGCIMQQTGGSGSGRTVTFSIPLAGMIEDSFDIPAGETAIYSKAFTVPSMVGPFSAISIDMAATLASVSVTPMDGSNGKGRLNLQNAPGVSQVNFFIAPPEQESRLCGIGDLEGGVVYGPFFMETNSANQLVEVIPATADLTTDTVRQINTGGFSLCVMVIPAGAARISVGNLAGTATMGDPSDGSGDCEPVADFAGVWHSTFSCTNSCGEGFGGDFLATVTQQGRQASYSDGSDTFSGTVCGNVFSFSVEPGAGYTETGTLTLNADGSATKISTYRSDDSGGMVCTGDCMDTFTRTGGSEPPGPDGDCVEFGSPCQQDGDCCDDFPCVNGICI